MSKENIEFSEDEVPTRPETPTSKSGKFKVCAVCSEFVEHTTQINNKVVCLKCSCIKIDGSYRLIKDTEDGD